MLMTVLSQYAQEQPVWKGSHGDRLVGGSKSQLQKERKGEKTFSCLVVYSYTVVKLVIST